MDIKELLQKSFWILVSRSLGAALMFLMTILFARWLGASDFGLFSLGLTVMTILSVFSRWGTDQVLLKQVGSNWETDPGIALAYTVTALKLVSIISIILALFISIFNNSIATNIFNKPAFSSVLFLFGLMAIPLTLNYTITEAFKGTGRQILAAYLQNVLTPLIAIIFGALLYYSLHSNLTTLSQSFAFGITISLLISMYFLLNTLHGIKRKGIKLKQIIREGWPMLIITSGGLIMAWSDIIIISILGSAEELGIYSAASRTVAVITLLLFVMNSITAPKYAKLYKSGDLKGLEKLAQNTSAILFTVGALPTIVLILFPEWILSWFGPEFIDGANVLIILSIGQFVNIIVGTSGLILTMSGHEKHMRKIILTTTLTNILLSVYFYHLFGIIGVALATAFSFIMWTSWAIISIKKTIGILVTPLKFNNFFNSK